MSQKYIIFKIAKNMGSTIDKILEINKNKISYVKIFSENGFDKKKIEKSTILFIAHETCIKKFKLQFNDIYNDAIKIIIFRNPLSRIESCYNYMQCNKPYSYYLKNILRNPENIKDYPGNYCAFYVHFETTQAHAIDYEENKYHSKKYIWLLMDDINKVFYFLKNKLNLIFPNNLYINKTKIKSGKKIKIKKSDMKLFNEKFNIDNVLYNKIKSNFI
jgi:hypothetical protein